MVHGPSLLVFFKTATLVLGGLITYFAYKASARTGSSALRALALGFGVVTVGSLIAGGLDLGLQFTGLVDTYRMAAPIVESIFTAVGFLIILYSLYVD
jgi:hypothetical protein